MEYDLEYLSRTHGFNAREMEKTCRISDVLEDVASVKFLGERLSLYGGTALNLIYFEGIPRLSVDLDFNYRHIDSKDWGEVRDEVDKRLKEIISARGYQEFRINPSYPLCRIDVSYVNSLGTDDGFMIEVGYMRRHPILKDDGHASFNHLGKDERFEVLTPHKEELFANKFGAALYRATSRDIYDLYRISGTKFEADAFRKCAVIDSLMRGRPPLTQIDPIAVIGGVSLDTSLRNLLRHTEAENTDFSRMREEAIGFCRRVIEDLTEDEVELIETFFTKKKFKPETIDEKGIFHPMLRGHPAIRRKLMELG